VSEVGLKSVGAAVESGAGEKTAVSGFSHVDEVALGAVRLTDQIGITARSMTSRSRVSRSTAWSGSS
jgi:predicted DNA-binding protein (UPF0251 family)